MADRDADVIDALLGITPGSPLDGLRGRRPQARAEAQATYRALFEPVSPGDFALQDRFAVAAFVAGLHRDPALAGHFAARLLESGAPPASQAAIEAAVAAATTTGPYGRYPAGPLTREDAAGPQYRADASVRRTLGPRLTAALEHAHLLVFHPRDANAAALEALLDAGWSTTDIVTLSQLVAFLTFQSRVVAGLRALAGHTLASESPA
jgi:CMD domain protein